MPEADEDGQSRGNSIEFLVELRQKNRPGQPLLEQEAKFEFKLVDTSREAGICLNAPLKMRPKRPTT